MPPNSTPQREFVVPSEISRGSAAYGTAKGIAAQASAPSPPILGGELDGVANACGNGKRRSGERLRRFCVVVTALAVWSGVQSAQAIPILQLYIEGSQYDSATESWVLDVGSTGGAFRLRAIANLGQDGSNGLPIRGVKLSAAYPSPSYAVPGPESPS